MITTLVVWMGGYLLGWIKLSPLPLVPVVSREKLLTKRFKKLSQTFPLNSSPQKNVQLPPKKNKNTCFSASKPQLTEEMADFFFCNPLFIVICRENAHPNKLLIGTPLKTLPAPCQTPKQPSIRPVKGLSSWTTKRPSSHASV